jgi:hypothetical protein
MEKLSRIVAHQLPFNDTQYASKRFDAVSITISSCLPELSFQNFFHFLEILVSLWKAIGETG